MRFLNPTECAEWCERIDVALDEQRRPSRSLTNAHRVRCDFPPSFSQLLWFSRVIESALQPRESCLAWVTQFGIFPSNENWQLYYRLRQSYGDIRLLHEAPGHLFLDFERPDVVSVIHLSLLFGWDLHLIPTVGYGRAFVCHDEWVELGFDDSSTFEETRVELERAKLKVSAHDAV